MLIPYLGEKTSISSFITPNIPEDISTYVEPFGGMFGVFFALRFSKFRDVKFVYNDINYLNYNLFNQLKNNTDFINLINETKVNQEIYKKSLLDIFKEKDNTQLALDWLVILTCSSPYEVGKYSWRDDSEFEVFKMKWKAYQFHVNKINEIHNLDYKKIIEMYDSESTFFYLDPPYMGRENLYLNHNFKEETHKELSEVLKNIKGRFLLSYYYFDGIEDYYTDCRFESSKTLMGTEYLIMNY